MKHSKPNAGAILGPLARQGWLATQPAEILEWVARSGRWQVFPVGKSVYDAGAVPDGLYGLADGAFEVTFPLIGDEPVVVHRAEPGFWIGEAAILAETARMVSIAAALESRVFHIPASVLRRDVETVPGLWRALYYLSNTNVGTAVRLLAEALALTPRARVARLLLRLSGAGQAIPVRQEELARTIGMTRSSLHRAMRSLVADGVVSTGYGRIVVLDRDALERLTVET